MLTLLEILNRSTEFLEKKGVPNARLDAEVLLASALSLKRLDLYLQFERPVAEAELERIRPLIKRRSQREPVQYILGEVEFYNIYLKVDRRALIPRPETEELVDRLIRALRGRPRHIVDLGCGSGAIGLALAKAYPETDVTLIDLSPEALTLARENGDRLGLLNRIQYFNTSWFEGLGEVYDVIVSNPPYLSSVEMDAVEEELSRYEPEAALSPGPVGSEALVEILGHAQDYLSPQGVLVMETGMDQHEELAETASRLGYSYFAGKVDLDMRPRFFLAGGEGAKGVIEAF